MDANTDENEIIVQNDVRSIAIPGGEEIILPKGTKCFIAQKLGGSYTLATDFGLVRVSNEDVEKLGIKKEKTSNPALEKSQKLEASGDLKSAIWEQLKQVFDPEIPVNIVDLGLVYDCNIDKIKDSDKNDVTIKMTLTAPGCGMGPVIAADAENKVKQLQTINQAKVELVWDPPWNQDMLSEVGKMKLGLI